MITLRAIVDALSDQVRSIAGLRVQDVAASNVNYPAALIVPPNIDYIQAFKHGFVRMELEVVVLVSAVADRNQRDLFDYIDWDGGKSIPAAIRANPALGLDGIEALARRGRSLSAEEVAGYAAWGAAIEVIITNTTDA